MPKQSGPQLSTAGRNLADALLMARKTGVLLDLTTFSSVARDEAMAVQVAVMQQLGDTAPASKVALATDETAIAAPLFSTVVATSGANLVRPPTGFSGLEVEIAIRLRKDLTPEMGAQGPGALLENIEAAFVGIELLGSRLIDPKLHDPNFFLADNLGNAAYVLHAKHPWTAGMDVQGLPLEVKLDGELVYSAPARHPFGGVLVALERYAAAPNDLYGCCKAGHLITTGTLCGVVPLGQASSVAVNFGNAPAIHFSIGREA